MSTFRKLAKSVVAHLVGADAPKAAPPAPPPPRARPAASPEATPTPAPSSAAAPAQPAAPAATAPRAAPPAPRGAAAEQLATIEASAQEVKERLDAGETVVLLDVRENFETAAGVIPGARLIPLAQLAHRWTEVADVDEVVCYCASGVRSLEAAQLLRRNGVFNATSLVGGVGEWVRVGGAIGRPSR